jgi:hypothetical protein
MPAEVKKGDSGKYGLLDTYNRTWLLKPEYEAVKKVADDHDRRVHYRVQAGDKFGLVYCYQDARPFHSYEVESKWLLTPVISVWSACLQGARHDRLRVIPFLTAIHADGNIILRIGGRQ